MKLKNFSHLGDYRFKFQFENGEIKNSDLKDLISSKVSLDEVSTAKIDSEWKCLEFKNGMVDIDPKTLYKYCSQN